MNTTQQIVTALIGVLMTGTILAMPAEMPGKSNSAIRHTGQVTLAPQKCQDQGLAYN